MKEHEFVLEAQKRAGLSSPEEAVKVIEAVLHTLGERLYGGEPKDLASQLPPKLGEFVKKASGNVKYGLNEFLEMISERAGVSRDDAVCYAQAIVSVIQDAVAAGEIADIKSQLPGEFEALFVKEKALK